MAPEAATGIGEASLRRELGFWLGTAVGVNAMIGTGIFKKSAPIARLVGSVDATLLVWVLGGVIALAGALSLAEVSAALPRTGGIYEPVRRAYGELPAFLLGYTRLVLLIPSALGGFAKLAAEALVAMMGVDAPSVRRDAVSATVIAVCVVANLVGVRISATQQAGLTAVKYVGVLGLAAVGLFAAFTPLDVSTLPRPTEPIAHSLSGTGLFAALVAVMWAYDGWSDLSSLAGEVRDPGKTIPRALIAATLVTTGVYVAMNLAYARVLGFEGLARSTVGVHMPAAHLASATTGALGLRVLAALMFASCLGASMSTLLTGPRVLVAMASDGVLFGPVGRVHAPSGVPRTAVLVSGGLGMVYVFFQSFEQLTDGFVVGLFPFYMLAVMAVFTLRRTEPELHRPFRVPWYPLPPLVFLAGGACTVLGALSGASGNTGFALLLVLSGVPIWALVRRGRATS